MNDQKPIQQNQEQFKRNIAFKHRIGSILSGKPIFEEDKLKFLEINDKNIIRVNIIANITEKYIQDGEKKFGSLTLDDATGQIKAKAFGDDINKFINFNQGDTILIIGLVRHWNDELYILPEIIKKKDPSFLLVRKLEVEAEQPKQINKEELTQVKEKIKEKIKNAETDGGIDIEKLILDLKEPPEVINREIKTLLENGLAYEPRPGRIRYLG